MAIIENDKDRVLQAATVRLMYTPENYIYFSTAAPVFNISAQNVASPASYSITAVPTGSLKGTVTWSVVSGTVSTAGQNKNTWTVAYADLTSDTAVIRATLDFLGLTYSSQLTVSKIKAGASAVSTTLSREIYAFPALENGTVTSYVGSGTEIRVYEGSTELTYDGVGTANGTWKVVTSATGITVGTITDGGTFATVDNHSGVSNSTDIADITYTITGKTSLGAPISLVKSQTFTKSKTAASSTVYSVIPSVNAISKGNDGAYTPTSISFSTTSTTGDLAPVTYAGRVVISTTTDGTNYTNTYTSSVNESSGTYIVPANITYIRLRLYQAGGTTTLLDQETIPVVSNGIDGKSPVILDLSNDTANISTLSDGSGGNFTAATTTATVYNGITDDTANWNITTTTNGGITMTGANTRTIAVSAMTSDVGYVDFTATRTGFPTLTARFPLAKAKAGNNGTSPVVIELSNDSHNIPTLFDGSGANFTGATTTATIYVGTTDDTANWNITTTVSGVTITGANSRTVTVDAISADAGYVDFSATRSGFPTQTARFSLARAKGGADGTPARVYRVTSSVGSIVKSSLGVYTPSTITFSSTSTTGNNAPVSYSGRFIIYTSTNGTTYTPALSSSNDQSSISYSIPANIKYVRAELYLSAFAALVDTETIPVVTDGQKGDDAVGVDGLKGISSRIIYYKAAQTTSGITPPGTPSPTTGQGTIPSPAPNAVTGLNGWTATAPTVGIGEIIFYSYGRYNPNPSNTVDGIAADTTVWSTPIGASVFQDIKSDNWGASVPANGNFNGATQGYYISRTEGSFYGSAVYLRGNSAVDISGKMIVRGSNVGSESVPSFIINSNTWYTSTANYGYVSENVNRTIPGQPGSNFIRAAVTGYAYNADPSSLNVGVVGIADGNSDNLGLNNAIGVIGVGRLGGGWFEAKGSTGAGIWARSAGNATKAAIFTGIVDITGTVNIIGNLLVTGSITATDNITAYSTSDIRFKNNIARITAPLEKLRALGGYSYDWTPDYLSKFAKEIALGLVKPHDVGVIAQEVLAQLPEAVNTRKDGTLAVNYEKLIPLLIEAILELDRKLK